MKVTWVHTYRLLVGLVVPFVFAIQIGCAPSGASCTSDKDCKGDRICSEGSCKDAEPVPRIDCAQMCARSANCFVEVCSKKNPARASSYRSLGGTLNSACLKSCKESRFTNLSAGEKAEFVCMLKNSCDAVYVQGVCGNPNTRVNC